MIEDKMLGYLGLVFMFATMAYALKKLNGKSDIFLLIIIVGSVVSIIQYEYKLDFVVTGAIMVVSALVSLIDSIKGSLWG